ncbi:exported protein of unknown function [Candidatus Hydrogenisulfobacillus filiaventi]|uniref:Uncharacterized protein n=1 Tax=Candidatus Hydrogenisulfobacillus filiaventi TaxID=2707344 RepID=A0A6F8ZHI0_9FIRM|nr:exported protein of unknown function [Candidatus Hydrogenisulfobacillus filiaventi]
MRRSARRRMLVAAGLVIGVAGVLAGCGSPPASHGAAHRTAHPYPVAADGFPVTLAGVQARYGKDFPGLVLRAPGAPKTPPFSLAAYPPNHAILWQTGPTLSDLSYTPPTTDTPNDFLAAETAAHWIIATNSNHPLGGLAYLDPQALVSPQTVRSGIPNLVGLQYWNLAHGLHLAARLVPGTHTPNGAYEYRTFAIVNTVEPASQWLSAANRKLGTYGPTPTLPDLPGFLPKGQHASAVKVVVVTSYNIAAGGGDYDYGSNGPTPVLVADVAGRGWEVVGFGDSLWSTIKNFPQHYVVPQG